MSASADPTAVPTGPVVLPEVEWQARRATHQRRVASWIDPHLERRRRGESHPVEDFLFSYYSYRPGRLRRWHPGAGVVLAGEAAAESYLHHGYVRVDHQGTRGVTLDTRALLHSRRDAVRRIHDLLVRTAGRPPQLGCFGMHEWAMVYRLPRRRVRHAEWPLRLSSDDLARVVEERGVRCSHVDAYRFFTPAARPLNVLAPTRERQADLEQPGCLHANMDLYKWAYKLAPMVDSELVTGCFALAREIRELDMRASPYDLRSLGHPPVRVETPEGRADYAAAQRGFADRAAPLRRRLATACAALLGI